MSARVAVKEIHRRGADEAGHELVDGAVVQVLGGIHLVENTQFHYSDPVGHGHSLGLIVGHVDEGGFKLLVELADLRTGLNAKFGVKVGKWLVQQEDVRLTHDGTAKGHTLTLTAGELAGLAFEQFHNAEDLGSVIHAALDLFFVHLAELEAEGHIVVDGHVGVESVGLKDHGNVTVFRGNIIDDPVANFDLTFADLFQPSQTAQSGRFAAT